MDYDADDTIFTGHFYNLNTHEFIKVNRSEFGKRKDFKRNLIKVFFVIFYMCLLLDIVFKNILFN